MVNGHRGLGRPIAPLDDNGTVNVSPINYGVTVPVATPAPTPVADKAPQSPGIVQRDTVTPPTASTPTVAANANVVASNANVASMQTNLVSSIKAGTQQAQQAVAGMDKKKLLVVGGVLLAAGITAVVLLRKKKKKD